MKKLIIACLAAAALVSLSACSSMNGTSATSTRSTVDSGTQSLVPFPDQTITTTDPMPIPNPSGQR